MVALPPTAAARTPEPPPTRARGLLVSLAAHAPSERDRACEARFGFEPTSLPSGMRTADTMAAPDLWPNAKRAPDESLADDRVGHHTSGVAPLIRAVLEVPIRADDVVVDLGSGLGKAAFILHLASGARVHGVELERELTMHATSAAAEFELAGVTFECGDARSANLHEGTVFYLYLPFTGATLDAVMERLRGIAARHAIVVVTLGLDLHAYPWLRARATDAFWLSIYDSACEGAEPRRASSGAEQEEWAAPSEENRAKRALAFER